VEHVDLVAAFSEHPGAHEPTAPRADNRDLLACGLTGVEPGSLAIPASRPLERADRGEGVGNPEPLRTRNGEATFRHERGLAIAVTVHPQDLGEGMRLMNDLRGVVPPAVRDVFDKSTDVHMKGTSDRGAFEIERE